MEKNFNMIYQTSFEDYTFMELQKYCTDLISKEPNKIFNSLNFSSISDKLLLTIIQSDNLQMGEIQLWEYVLKWGLAQNPDLPSNLTEYSQDDFNNLKNTLKRFIPLINFRNLTSKEFLERVFPYEKIFPDDLYKGLLKGFLSLLDPNSKLSEKSKPDVTKEIKRTVDSKIITYKHVELISRWIDRLETTDNLISSYKFKLLFRASRDRHSRDKFHEICDNKPRTVTIIKVKDSNEILGGYNPTKWKSDGSFSATEDSFIFSFNDCTIDSYILSRVIDEEAAIYNSSDYGPSFGAEDLEIWTHDGNYCKQSTNSCYEQPIRKTETKFTIDECEVFQIVRD
ncbi:carbohydrate-binding module family 13 protein [Rhizophagus clarus]|uniref:Carbohydrate-binding module family 13 protein n=1 Tax=Rhizophagus clarus TaxID=94130 RepID=A0A8H3KYY4_9GLOM|nr:carbohydrate-binding module family 13 protein [Rhizophagus clarus]